MPRPTFIQAVLRKPARSYADPDAPLPWSDSYHDPRYPAPADDYPPAYPLHPHDARPRRRISRPGSAVSASAASDTSRTRFPKPSRKATHHVLLRDGEIIHAPVAESLSAAPSVRSTRRTEKLTKPANVPAKTTKKKRKPKPVINDRSDSSLSLPVSAGSFSVSPPASAGSFSVSPPTSAGSFSTPPGLHSRFSETSSASSSALIPISPVAPTLAPRVTQGARPLPAKAPASRQSTPSSSFQSVTRPASIPPKIIETETVGQHVQQGSDSEDEVFYTPRSSFSFSFNATLPEELPDPIETPKAVEMAGPMLDPVVTPKQKTDILLGAPVFNLLPPTPAPMPDPISTPFHSQPASPIDRSSLHPDHLPHTTSRPSLAPRVIIPPRNIVGKPPPLPPKDDEDMESASGQAGSDDEESHRHRRGGGDYSCTPKSSSRPCSRAQSIRSSSRRSHHTPHNSLKDLDTSRPTSEASFGSGGGGVSRGSSVVAGFGKGGWAAAAASTGSRSGATTPVMFLPANGTTGWEGFQPAGASAPRRHSKFTPLPAASLPSFDRLVNSPSLADGSIHSPSNTPVPVPVSYSSPSEYSQASVSDNLGRLSEAEADGQEDSRQTWNTMGSQPLKAPVYRPRTPSPLPPSSSSPYRLSHYSRPTSPSLPLESTWRPSPSQPQSPSQSQSQSQSQSPIPTRPTTPRAGFEPPSFLDPDILTILPEMTPQDSERLYRPSSPPPERSRSRLSVYHDNGGQLSHSTRSSVFRGSKSEVGHGQAQGQGYEHGSEAGEEDDGLAELPLPSMIKRSKSAAGYRFGGGSKWEGSSYGDGVLMESHGRDQESAPGYT